MLDLLNKLHNTYGPLKSPHYWSPTTPLVRKGHDIVEAACRMFGAISVNHTSPDAMELAARMRDVTGCRVAVFVDVRKITNYDTPVSDLRVRPDLWIVHSEGVEAHRWDSAQLYCALCRTADDVDVCWYHAGDYGIKPSGSGFSEDGKPLISSWHTVDCYDPSAACCMEMYRRTREHPARLPVLPFVPFGFLGKPVIAPKAGEKSYTYPPAWREPCQTWALAQELDRESCYLWDIMRAYEDHREECSRDLEAWVAGHHGVAIAGVAN